MKHKIKHFVLGGLLGIVGLGLVLPIVKEGVVSVAKAEAIAITVGADDITLDKTSPYNKDLFYFNLAENGLTASEAGENRFKATAASGVLTVHRAAGGDETHAVNLAKQTATRYYVQFDNWSGDKFSLVAGDTFTLNGVASHANGNTITFSNVTVSFTSMGYTIGSPEEINIARNEATVRLEDAAVGNIYVKTNEKMTAVAGNAIDTNGAVITIEPASGDPYQVKSTAYVNDANIITIYLYDSSSAKITSLDAGTKIKFVNTKFAALLGNKLYVYTFAYMYVKWNGTKFENITDSHEIVRTVANVTDFASVFNTCDIVTYTFDTDDGLPVNSAWDKGWVATNAMKVTRMNGTVVENHSIWIIKSAAKKYQILWNISWKTPSQFTFTEGDVIELNFSINTAAYYDNEIVTFQNLTLIYISGLLYRADGYIGKAVYNDKNTYINPLQRAYATGIYIPFAEDDTVGHEIEGWKGAKNASGTFSLTRSGSTTDSCLTILSSGGGYYASFETWSTKRAEAITIQDGDEITISGMYVFNYTVESTFKTFLVVLDNLKYSGSNSLINRVVPAIETFVADYMHMDYVDNLGYCKDSEHHYYTTAKAAFLEMDVAYRKVLMNDPSYAHVANRLVAWATANGETIDTISLTISSLELPNEVSTISSNTSTVVIIVAIMAIASTGLILLKKRKMSK